MNKEHDFAVEGDGDYQMNDASHFYNHLNYLFRTDGGQKWTNDLTSQCVFVDPMRANGNVRKEVIFGDLGHREQLRSMVLDGVKEFFKTTNLGQGRDVKKLFAFTLYAVDGGGGVIDAPTRSFPFKQLARSFDECEVAHLFAMVVHVDQRGITHLHGLYAWEGRKPRGRSRFGQIIECGDTEGGAENNAGI